MLAGDVDAIGNVFCCSISRGGRGIIMVRTPGEADATDSGNADSCRTNGRSVDMRSVDVCSTSADGASS